MSEWQRSALIHLAARLVRGELLPDIGDNNWYKSTPLAERRFIMGQIERAAEQHRELAIEVRTIADSLRAAPSPAQPEGT